MFKVPTLQKLRFQLLAKKELGHCDYVGAASLKWTLSYVDLMSLPTMSNVYIYIYIYIYNII